MLWNASAETPFNIVATRTVFVAEGDSLTANTGQASWVTTFTNLMGQFHFITNAAHNGDFIDGTGITTEYPTEVQVWTNAAYTNLLAVWIGANNGSLATAGDHTNFIRWFSNYLAVATNDSWHVAAFTISPQYRSTNDSTGAQYEIERAACNAYIRTNSLKTWLVDVDSYFPLSTLTDAAIYVDNPPLHFTDYAAAVIGTNAFYVMTTNPVPIRWIGRR